MASSIQLKGDWRKLRTLANKMENVQDIEDAIMPEVADKVKEALEVVVSSSPPPPNAPSTLAKRYKRGKGTLQETGGFPHNIVIDNYKQGKRDVYVIKGSDAIHPRTHTSYEDLVGILNNGSASKNLPARPILKTAFDLVQDEIKYVIVNRAKSIFK